MMGEGTGRSGVIGLLASLAIHLSLAVILVWPSGQRLQAGWGEAHAATAGADRLQRSVPSARPRPDTLDSTGQIAATPHATSGRTSCLCCQMPPDGSTICGNRRSSRLRQVS